MPDWKKRIFARVIARRAEKEERNAADILNEYEALTSAERREILLEMPHIKEKQKLRAESSKISRLKPDVL